MASLARRFAAALLLGGFAAAFIGSGNAADDKKLPDAETIMKKVNGKKGLVVKIAAFAKDEKWDDAQKSSKELKELADALAKNDPHKGDKESWAKLTKKYADDAGTITDAVEKKDKKAVEKATATFTAKETCAACHKVHKP